MIKFSLIGATVIACAGMTFATTTQELAVQVGTNAAFFTTPGTTTYTNANYFGWDISIVSGVSNSPSVVPFGEDLSVQAQCVSAACALLTVQMSDLNFTQSPQAFQLSYSNTGGGGANTGDAWESTSNGYFVFTQTLGTVSLTGLGSGSIDTTVSSHATPYSLTLGETFAGTSNGLYSGDAQLVGVPEPGAILLFGTLLFFSAVALRRKLMN